jgi:uncharacterized protein (DUF2225 family)
VEEVVGKSYEQCPVCKYEYEETRYLHDSDISITKGDDCFIIKQLHKGNRSLLSLIACPKCKSTRLLW